MKEQEIDKIVLGVMSGTSLDGIDLSMVHFSGSWKAIQYTFLASETIPYSEIWKENLDQGTTLDQYEIHQLDLDYSQHLSNTIQDFLGRHPHKVDLIASHGHTIFHQPENGMTKQIGNLANIFHDTGIPTVCEFRVQDVALGGQGAPLVPIGDQLLFGTYDFCLNLGGFANVSTGSTSRIAFDICPVNIVLNELVKPLGLPFDEGGLIARGGDFNQDLFDQLNQLKFYKIPAPKSLGKEWVEENIWVLLKPYNRQAAIRTFTDHAAFQIAQHLPHGNTLITGGGAYNDYLIEKIGTYSATQVHLPERELIEFKEALVFALLGLLKWNNKINCLSSVTGASKDHSSGVIYC